MGDLIEVVLPVFILIGFGYASVRFGLFPDKGVDAIMAFAQKFAIPCLLFGAIARLDLHQSFDVTLLASFYTGAVTCFALGILGARYLFGRPWEDCIAIGFAALFSNSVLLGLPISERAYGLDSLAANYTIIAIHSPVCYFLGITGMELVRGGAAGGGGLATVKRVLKAMFSNALILGLALGFAVNLGGITVPEVLFDSTDMMARAGLPAALFGIGGVLTRYRPEGDMLTVGYVASLSLILHPVITLSMGTGLGIDAQVLRNGVINAAMPPGVNCYLFADMYGRGKRVAATTVLVATATSVLSLWIWLQILG